VSYCPRCGQPVSDLLCITCGWFGDDVLTEQPGGADIVVDMLGILHNYRAICRGELELELRLPDSVVELAHAKQFVSYTKQSIIEMFLRIARPITQVLKEVNGYVPWPKNWLDRHYNGNEPCDTLRGPCACGAFHQTDEDWVQEKLAQHNAEIQNDNPEPA
jgi:hypothetical protein